MGEPFESNVVEGAALAASLDPDALIFEGSGACIPPVEVDSTVCVVGQGAGVLHGLGSYHLMRSRLALAMGGDRELAAAIGERFCPALACELVPEPLEPPPNGARVALFSTSAARPPGLELVVALAALFRRPSSTTWSVLCSSAYSSHLVELKAAGDRHGRRAR